MYADSIKSGSNGVKWPCRWVGGGAGHASHVRNLFINPLPLRAVFPTAAAL